MISSNKEYINIIFSQDKIEKLNPIVILSLERKCKNDRLYLSTQNYGPIYIFLKSEQFPSTNKPFYICIKQREKIDSNFKLIIKANDKAYLPFNMQTNYYISNSINQKMKFIFPLDNSYDSNSEVTIWAKGRSISKINVINFDGKEHQFNGSFIFYDKMPINNIELTIESEIGDSITIGSTIINKRKVVNNSLEENSNELIIAIEGDVCIPYTLENSVSYITGKIYEGKATYDFIDEENNQITINNSELTLDFENDIFIDFNTIKEVYQNYLKGYICLKSDKLMIFSIQMIYNGENQIFHPVLIPGDFRQYFLEKYKVAIFYSAFSKNKLKSVDLYLESLKGSPKIYIDECETFPNCTYNNNSIMKLKSYFFDNKIANFSFISEENLEKNGFNSISSLQPLMIVYCGEGENSERFPGVNYCEFNTTFLVKEEQIKSEEKEEKTSFGGYIKRGEKNDFNISLQGSFGKENKIYIDIDLLIFSGDVDISINGKNENITVDKYYLSNKIFYSVHNVGSIEILKFEISAYSNAFYNMQYQIKKDGNSEDINTLDSGINYITSKRVDSPVNKTIILTNQQVENEQPYLATFYSPNCQYEVFWENKKIEQIDKHAQIIIQSNEKNYKDKLKFSYIIKNSDESEYQKNKFCMVYVAGLELASSIDNWNGRSILLSEGVPHKYTYTNDFPFMFYSYNINDNSNALLLNFNLIDKAYFNIKIKINNNIDSFTVYRKKEIYIQQGLLEEICQNVENCKVDLN